MPKIDTIVVGGSAGSVEALSRLVSLLPADLPAALIVVVHFPESSTSVLPDILSRNGSLPAKHAEDGELIVNGCIYVARPGHHLLVRGDCTAVVVGPKENGNRPAIDPLFRTAAQARGNRVVGVLLSGLLDDGTMGMWSIRRHGGRNVVQDPEEALFGDMPRSAIDHGAAERALPLEEIGSFLVDLAGQEVDEIPTDQGVDPTEMNLSELSDLERRGRPSAFVCPECSGTLFELSEDGVPHYRCRVGHSYMAESLSASQEGQLEAALWTAVRAVEEHNDLLATMLQRAQARGFELTAKSYRAKLEEGNFRMEILRQALGLPRPGQGEATARPETE